MNSFSFRPFSWFAVASLSSLAPVLALETVLIESSPPAAAMAIVPSLANGGSTLTVADWTMAADPPNVANWIGGTTAVGYEATPASGTSYASLIGLDLLADMQNNNGSAYVRVPFTVSQPVLDSTVGLTLEMNYDDGFIAYLNGVQVLSVNPPAIPLDFESVSGGGNPDGDALAGASFDLTPFIGALTAGDNMLAFHGLNDGTTSSDFLILPKLIASDVSPPAWPDLQLGTPVITGVTSPVDIAHAGDGSGRLFIVERGGRIRIWTGSRLLTFLDIDSRVGGNDSGGDERGLLGVAFPPDYATKQHFYVNYTNNSNDTVVSRFSVNPGNANDAVETSEEILLVVDQPENNHNGGQMHFGKDGYLYIGFGDGGGGGDNHGSIGNGQQIDTFQGKMLRIDVEGPADPGLNYAIPANNPFVTDATVPNEIWAFGLRNPWRWSFDRKTGDMYIADVGQGTREEVSVTPASSTGGENYQWRQKEGFFTHSGTTPLTKGISTDPVLDYPRGDGTSITGGYVYRGAIYPRMQGVYFYGDYNSGRIWGLQPDGEGGWSEIEFLDTTLRISCFGEDEEGEVYVASLFTGQIHKLTDTRDSQYLQIIDATFSDQGEAEITFGTEIGRDYQLQSSTDLINWSDLGLSQTASQFTLTANGALSAPLPEHAFFRILELAN